MDGQVELPEEMEVDSSEFLFAMVPEDLIFSEVSDAALRVYAAIQRLGRNKGAKVTHRMIGERLGPRLGPKAKRSDASGMSDAKVKRAIAELESAGWLTVKRRRGPLGHNLPSVYKPLSSRATGLVSGQVTGELRTVPSEVTGEPRVEPKLTGDLMPKLTGDLSIDSSLESGSKEPSPVGRPAPLQPQLDLDAPAIPSDKHQADAEALCERIYALRGSSEPFDQFKARLHRKVWARDWLAPAREVVKVEGADTIDAVLAFLASGDKAAQWHVGLVIDAKTLASHCNRNSLSSKATAWAAKRDNGATPTGPQAPDVNTALAIAQQAFNTSRRPGAAPIDDLLASEHPAILRALDATYQAFRTLTEDEAGWKFRAAYAAVLANLTKSPTTTGPTSPHPKEAA